MNVTFNQSRKLSPLKIPSNLNKNKNNDIPNPRITGTTKIIHNDTIPSIKNNLQLPKFVFNIAIVETTNIITSNNIFTLPTYNLLNINK